jgi:hypothetical protein
LLEPTNEELFKQLPYIKKETRRLLKETPTYPTDAGELNYLITMICNEYIHENSKNYQRINDVVGALEGAKLEFYRRVAAPYEDKKIIENGDVYTVV